MKIPALSPEFATAPGAQAAWRLLDVCRYVEHETETIAHFLVSLHNARFARPDAYLLCRTIDDVCFEDVMTVMRWFRDMPGYRDLQDIFGDQGQAVMADLMARYGLLDTPRF